MRWPWPSARSCSSASKRSAAVGESDGVLAQEAHAVGVDADVAIARASPPGARRATARRRRAHTGSARARSTARSPRASTTTFTTLGSKNVAAESIGCAAVAIEASGCRASSPRHLADELRIDERLVALDVHHDLVGGEARAAPPPRRGDRCRSRASGEVMQTLASRARATASAMSSWSVAITTSSAPLCARALRDPGHERLAADVGEHLSRQARRAHARRDDDREGERAPAPSGLLVGARACAPRPRASPGCRPSPGRRGGRPCR